MYLATAPALFTQVVEQIAAAGLNGPQTRVVLEKPLGHDLASNRAINKAVCKVLAEHQVFRIDHYLGKPSVQNLFAMRFGNALFEPIWRREHIANIQITIAEDLGVEKRGAFYDQTGALRDMVQNHALQLVCAIGMEPPINAHADAIRDEKLKVLRALKPWTAESHRPARDPRPVHGGHGLRRARAGLPRRAGRRPGQPHRDLRRAAHRDRQLALGRRAALHPHRQAAGLARCAHRGQLQADAACDLSCAGRAR